MLKRFRSIIAVATAVAGCHAHTFYVAPGGSDSNSGTSAKPFKTFGKAKAAVANVIPSMTEDITVIFDGGTYPITETVTFGLDDSPKGNHTITYKAAENETPLFTGGVPVVGWEKHDSNLWKAPLKRDEKLRALYVNDQRAVMAHGEIVSAQGGWGEYVVTAGQAEWAWQDGTTADGIKYKAGDLPKITRNPIDVEIENQTTWNKNFIGVREIVRAGNSWVFKLQQPYGAIAQQIGWNAGLRLKGKHIIHNAFELLDEPGEFYFDRTEGLVYYYPRAGENMATASVVAPVTETLLRIEGEVPDKPVRNLIFDGLTFAHTDYNLENIAGSRGKATLQTATVNTVFANSNWHYDVYRSYDVLPGAIIANGIENVTFTRNTIKHTGCEGLALNNGIDNVRVVGNIMQDCGGSAIALGHPQHVYENDTPDLKHAEGVGIEKEKYRNGTEAVPRNVLIANNFLPDNAALFNGHTVITVFFSQDVTIEHNWIPNAPYSGMNVGWGWCDFDGAAELPEGSVKADRIAVFPGKPTTVAGNNVIRANRVEKTMSILHDGGAIYTLGGMPDSVIERNYVQSTEHGIYTDEGSANISSRFNVVHGAKRYVHNAGPRGRKRKIAVEHYFTDRNEFRVDGRYNSSTNHVICSPDNWPAEAQEIIDASGLEPEWLYLAKSWKKPPSHK
ncbi:right-handed parallel beta-helix repeat-containing protein [Pontiellaceae bacterium B1224]|nr:right-handed parallel beta-helix repeat-containing protein [Pontiellaceae bacterium B1224]